MRLLDRYVLRSFAQAYLYCIVAFVAIWVIFDVSDNISTVLDERLSAARVVQSYLAQMPQVLVLVLPIALLLALLFSLGRMSRANEIVSILTAGISIPRLLLPLVGVGLVTTFASSALNYSLAPHAELARKTYLETDPTRKAIGITGQMFRNRTDNRVWFIQHFRPGENTFDSVQITQLDEQDNIVANYLATRAYFRPETNSWSLEAVKVVYYDAAGNIIDDEIYPSLIVEHWSETPYRLTSSNARAESLGLAELREYLRLNADFPPTLLAPFRTHLHYLIALPWTCLIVIFIAAPLGIGYSRRGMLSSVAAAIVLVFVMNLLTHLFLALGEGDRIPPWLAAWTPNMIFAIIGARLLHLRSTNRNRLSLAVLVPRRIFAR